MVNRPLVHAGGRELIRDLPDGVSLELEFLKNPAGELRLIDSLNLDGPTLSELRGTANLGETRVAGLRTAGAGLLTILNPTTVRIAAGTSEIMVERLPGGVATEHVVTWSETDIVVSGISNPAAFYEVQDATFTGTGTVVETSAPPDDAAERGGVIFLGESIHSAGAVTLVLNAPRVINEQGALLRTLLKLLGTLRTSGNISEVAATLTHTHSAIGMFGEGINWQASPVINPHGLVIPASLTPATFEYIEPDGTTITSGESVFQKEFFDTGGPGLTALTGRRAVVHQIVMSVAGLFVQVGTTSYKDYNEAVQAIGAERINNPLFGPIEDYGDVLGYAVVANDATVWADGFAHLFEELPFGSSFAGGGVSTLDGMTDTPDSKAGEDGKVLFVNAAEDGTQYGKIRAQIMIPIGDNIPTITLDVADPAHVNAAEFRIESVHLEVKVAPTVDLEIDVTIAGSSIFGATLPKIAAAALVGTLAPTTTDHFQGDRIRVDVASADVTWGRLVVTLEGWIVPE